jgi:uncharacterized membrane protein YphA (DoxX/SURF4 family)
VIVVATPFDQAVAALKAAGPVDGKVVIDISNPMTADYSGLSIGHDTSAAEEIAKAIPKANVVKAFNTLFAQVLAQGASFGNGTKAPAYVAADSERAKATATALIESIGFQPVDAGPLKNARYLEPLAGLNIYSATARGRARTSPRPGSIAADCLPPLHSSKETTMNSILSLLGRAGLALIFIISGWGKIAAYAGTQQYMEAMGVPGALLPLVIVLELGGGLAILAGAYTRWVAIAIAAFSILAATIFHGNFADPMQAISFWKNLAIAGGFFVLAANGPGSLSLDAVLARGRAIPAGRSIAST